MDGGMRPISIRIICHENEEWDDRHIEAPQERFTGIQGRRLGVRMPAFRITV
jgi:hypothetical protein